MRGRLWWALCGLVGALGSAPARAEAPLSLTEALETALQRHPDLLTQRLEVERVRGAALAAGGPFDYEVAGTAGYDRINDPQRGLLPAQEIDQVELGLQLDKRFRVGTVISPSIRLSRVEVDAAGDTFQDFGPATTAVVAFEVTQPLLRNFGYAVSAGEQAAEILVDAAQRDFEHRLAERALATADAYFAFVAAHRQVEVLRGAEARFDRLYASLEELVEADERPRAELLQISASQANRRRTRIAAERRLLVARFQLGLQMGLTRDEISALGAPATALSDGGGAPPPVPALVDRAVALRRDRAAALRRLEATELLVTAAANAALPALDVSGSVGYAGFVDGGGFGDFWLPLGQGVPGVNGSVRLTFAWPVLNAQREGAEAQAVAARRQARVAFEQIDRELRAAVQVARSNVVLDDASHAEAEKAVELFTTAVDNERTKLRLGLATVIDAVVTEDRLTDALQSAIDARASFLRSVLRLRFETGTLVQLGEGGGRIDPAALVTVPETD